jgi:transcription termination factor NusA
VSGKKPFSTKSKGSIKTTHEVKLKRRFTESKSCGKCEGCMLPKCGQCIMCLEQPNTGTDYTNDNVCLLNQCHHFSKSNYNMLNSYPVEKSSSLAKSSSPTIFDKSKEKDNIKNMIKEKLNLDENIIEVLIKEGFSSLEELAYIPIQELFDIKDLKHNIVKEIREKARNALIVQAIKKEEYNKYNNDNLLKINGMTKKLSDNLKKNGILTRNDLAELDADTLLNLKINELVNYDACANLIMLAREHWFN